jgi:hypothetical protein
VEPSRILFLRGDPRIVEYVAERIPLRPKTPHEARALYTNLKEHLEAEARRAIVEKLGYKYEKEVVKRKEAKGQKRAIEAFSYRFTSG